MNKRAGVGILLKFIIGLVIAISFIYLLLTVADNFLLFGKGKIDQQVVFFDKLNNEIENVNINGDTTQAFELKKGYLLIAFNNKDAIVENRQIIKKPIGNLNYLCLCKTKSKYLFEDDCLQVDDICTDYKRKITNNNQQFYLFEEGLKNLKIKKTSDKIDISF